MESLSNDQTQDKQLGHFYCVAGHRESRLPPQCLLEAQNTSFVVYTHSRHLALLFLVLLSIIYVLLIIVNVFM